MAYDVYLAIQRRVHLKIQAALGHNTPNYLLLNVCPACFYKLEDEPELEFSMFIAMDGNNSLRRLGPAFHNTTARIDSRSLESDRWLTPQEVNRFAHEVKGRRVVSQVMM